MDLEEIGINAGNWVDSAQDRNYWRALVNVGIELPDSISHGVSQLESQLVKLETRVRILIQARIFSLKLTIPDEIY